MAGQGPALAVGQGDGSGAGREPAARLVTALVACAILVGALTVLMFSVEAWDGPWRPAFALAYVAMTFVFLARGLAGYIPALWRRTRTTSFYRLNRLYYSPLCLLIAAGLVVNFILG
ncbi:DUF3995 domain-containing protein [Phenylobacterium sp.]|uniref:DUF3995 domain-containing protein n=1 Tax=Phenylobacterium sp. TaxID=1871053 RepID=UPI00272089F2|nr:DUF3995 domain-containing protein [Phenylobacterium sp.]MDO8378043.1 DUF3995 domain-containing protein [Phenylobacterium sp.]